ncbi:MAG: NAD-dependent epimerase/dehydratase family protein [Desulfobulbales bacterium]
MLKTSPRPQVCITGSNGFIGSHVADAFFEAGIPVLCQLRPGSPDANLKEAGHCHHLIRCPLDNPEAIDSLAQLFQGLECVIHVAGYSSDWGSYSLFEAGNIVSTRNVCTAALRAGVRRLIVAGSISSYGEENHLQPKSEKDMYAPRQRYPLGALFPSAMHYYRESKAEASRWAMDFAGRHGLQLTLLEPVWIFGERESSSGFLEYLDTARILPLIPGCRTNIFPVFYVRDLARAFLLVFQRQPQGVNRYIVGSLRQRRMHDIYSTFCHAADIRPPRLLSRPPCMIIGMLLEALWCFTRRRHPPPLSRSRVTMLFDSIPFSAEKFHKTFGPFPETPFAEAVQNTTDWYKHNRNFQ